MPAKKAPPKPVVRRGKNNGSGAIKLDPESRTSKMIARQTEGNMSDRTRDRADRFVAQYLRDFNATQAFIRLSMEEGKKYEEVDYNYAMNKGYQMKRWPYVANKIQEAMEIAEEANILTNKEILWGVKREMNYGGPGASHGARVSALALAAKIRGMESPKKVEASVSHRGGVMIVPETEDLTSWEQRASAAQATLKEEVRK